MLSIAYIFFERLYVPFCGFMVIRLKLSLLANVENQNDSTDNLLEIIGELNKVDGGVQNSTAFFHTSSKNLENTCKVLEISSTQE